MRRRTSKESKQFAKENNLECEVIYSDMLFIDIDTVEQMKQFDAMLPSLYHMIYHGNSYEPKIFVNRSKSDNFHVRIRLPNLLESMERVALQLMLGSDPKKEACSILGFKQKDGECILAFETKGYEDRMVHFNHLNGDTLAALDFENKLGQKKGKDMLYFLECGHEPMELLKIPIDMPVF
jgi:hypothetical protein